MNIAEEAESIFWPDGLNPGTEFFITQMMRMQVFLLQQHLQAGDITHWDRPRALRTLDRLAFQLRTRAKLTRC